MHPRRLTIASTWLNNCPALNPLGLVKLPWFNLDASFFLPCAAGLPGLKAYGIGNLTKE
jgi:hypothetical protein